LFFWRLGAQKRLALFLLPPPQTQPLLLNYIGGATNRGIATAPTEALVAQVTGGLGVEGK
jgi:hypothetical protein